MIFVTNGFSPASIESIHVDDFNFVDHERAIGFKPAMGPAHHLSLLPGLDGVMLPLSVTFKVPVGLKFEGFGFQEVLPGRVRGGVRWKLLYEMPMAGGLHAIADSGFIHKQCMNPRPNRRATRCQSDDFPASSCAAPQIPPRPIKGRQHCRKCLDASAC